jgi:three-Cys-motif partner protein
MTPKARQQFGGFWTEEKLIILQKYLSAFTNALKRQPFELWYIDAFAGTGYIETAHSSVGNNEMLPGLGLVEPIKPLEGSAKIALKVKPPFHHYVFIESKRAKVLELKNLLNEFPDIADKVEIVKDDCNDYLLSLCRKTDWSNKRAVIFIDPCGMQVDWNTIEVIAKTKAFDVWNLFPIMGASRMLPGDGNIPESWCSRLDKIFGIKNWRDELYKTTVSTGFFGSVTRKDRVSIEDIAKFYLLRMKRIFACVSDKPRIFTGKTNQRLFYFFFAVSNPRAVNLATKIADSIKGQK